MDAWLAWPAWPSSAMQYVFTLIAIALPVTYWFAIPTLIPGIPYNKSARINPMGDLPKLIKHYKKTSEINDWVIQQTSVLKSPIVQLAPGPFMRKPLIVVTDQQEAEDILIHRFKEFDRLDVSNDRLETVAQKSTINMATHETFRAQRRLWAPTMSTPFLRDVAAEHVNQSAQHLIELWRRKAEAAPERPYSGAQDLKFTTLDAIYAVTFGAELGGLKSQVEASRKWVDVQLPKDPQEAVDFPAATLPDLYSAIITILQSFQDVLTSPFPLIHFWLVRHMPRYRNANNLQRGTMKRLLDESRTKFAEAHEKGEECAPTSSMEHVFTREASAHQTPENKRAFSERAMLDEMFLFLLAGYETTSTTLAWGLKYLTANQSIQKRLYEALDEHFGNVQEFPPSPSDISNVDIPYLSAVIAEIQRSARVAPAVVRTTTQETTLLGHVLPKGVVVMFSLSSDSYCNDQDGFSPPPIDLKTRSQSSAKRTPDWEPGTRLGFLPERWLHEDEQGHTTYNPNAGPSLPFSQGPRSCFGRKLATTELKILLVQLVLNFEFGEVSEALTSWDARELVTRTPQTCYIRPVPRLSRG
ncbi:MAG: hypothetical protein M1828_002282 [Chrysothrix sp. TS-e1954]|nr:MAG: hypothetical protein M1828_002282 [Chrysothrix sp. TS-e1954]